MAAAQADFLALQRDGQAVRAESSAARRAPAGGEIGAPAASWTALEADGRREIGPIESHARRRRFLGGESVATAGAGQGRAEDSPAAGWALAREEPIASGALRRRGEKLLPALRAGEAQREPARWAVRICLRGCLAAVRTERAPARAAYAVEAGNARAAVGAALGLGVCDGVDKGCAALGTASRPLRNLLPTVGARQDEHSAARGARHGAGVQGRATRRAALAAAGRAYSEVVRHQPVAVRARLFLEEDCLAVWAARVGGEHFAAALRAGQRPLGAAVRAGRIVRPCRRAAIGADELPARCALIVSQSHRRIAGGAGDVVFVHKCSRVARSRRRCGPALQACAPVGGLSARMRMASRRESSQANGRRGMAAIVARINPEMPVDTSGEPVILAPDSPVVTIGSRGGLLYGGCARSAK